MSLQRFATVALAASLMTAAAPGAAQQVQAFLGGGPTWRGTGTRGASVDAVTVEAGLGTDVAPHLDLRLIGGLTVGGATEALAVGAPCDPDGRCPGGRLGVLVPGSQYHARAGLAWSVPGLDDRLELQGGAGVYTASVAGPDAVLGLHAGLAALPLRRLGIGLEVARLTSDLGTVRWLVTPSVRIQVGAIRR